MKKSIKLLLQVLFILLFVLFYNIIGIISFLALAIVTPMLAYIIPFIIYEFLYSTTHDSSKGRKYLDSMVFCTVIIQLMSDFLFSVEMSTAHVVGSIIVILIALIFVYQKMKDMKINLELIFTFILLIGGVLVNHYL